LIESRPAPAFSVGSPQPAPQPAIVLPYSEFTQMIEHEAPPPSEPAMPSATQEFALRPEPGPEPRFDFGDGEQSIRQPSPGPRPPVPETHGDFPPGMLPPFSSSLTALGDLRPLGQIHESFIIAAGRDGLWIIDQHVAHERILFEKVLKQRAAGRVETQALLMPLILQLTAEQQVEYARIADELQSIGFETEPFGARTIAVKAAPAAVAVSDLEKLIFEILEIADGELRGLSMEVVRRNIAASVACRAAIKINTRLDGANTHANAHGNSLRDRWIGVGRRVLVDRADRCLILARMFIVSIIVVIFGATHRVRGENQSLKLVRGV
jgi:DNA mismatch repair protein MutL